MIRYPSILFARFQAASALATLYVSERMLVNDATFARSIETSELLAEIRPRLGPEHYDMLERLQGYLRTPRSFDKQSLDAAERILAMLPPKEPDNVRYDRLMHMVRMMSTRRTAFIDATRRYGRYNIPLSETAHAKPSQGAAVHA